MKTISPEDLRALTDRSAEPSRRAQALSRLAHWEKGSFNHLEGTIAGLLDDDEPMVRGAAIKTLLSGWELEKYLPKAIAMLREASGEDGWMARSNAAFALGQYARFTGRDKDKIVRALVAAMQSDPDSAVQRACYEQLLQILDPDRDPPDSEEFDNVRDVDWKLLEPYR
jgi:hypothetical protein